MKFFFQMKLVSCFIQILNKYNVKFQSQKASISDIKKHINECYFSFLELTLKPSESDKNINEILIMIGKIHTCKKKFF